jgi:hypothetical protein
MHGATFLAETFLLVVLVNCGRRHVVFTVHTERVFFGDGKGNSDRDAGEHLFVTFYEFVS